MKQTASQRAPDVGAFRRVSVLFPAALQYKVCHCSSRRQTCVFCFNKCVELVPTRQSVIGHLQHFFVTNVASLDPQPGSAASCCVESLQQQKGSLK